jgi:hypothetical protein
VDCTCAEPLQLESVALSVRPRVRQVRTDSVGASRIVQRIDPSEDVELLTRSGLPAPRSATDPPRAYVHRGRESYAERSDPVRSPARMPRTERVS